MMGDARVQAALVVLEAAYEVAEERTWADSGWDLVYLRLGTAVTVIQSTIEGALPAGGGQDVAPAGRGGSARSCPELVHEAGELLRGGDLGADPILAVAINAVADAHAVLKDIAR